MGGVTPQICHRRGADSRMDFVVLKSVIAKRAILRMPNSEVADCNNQANAKTELRNQRKDRNK